MHIFFSGIGGHGIGPLALIAKQAGYDVSGSDQQSSAYTEALQKHGVKVQIGQSQAAIAKLHSENPIDWLVYSSAVPLTHPDHPELVFAKVRGIRASKRDELLNRIIQDSDLQLIAIAGTHGKTTTTAMVVWLFKTLGLPMSYLVGAKIGFGPTGQFNETSRYFVYECDEFDRNFLAFNPHLSIITGVSWDHHEIFPTRKSYYSAFCDFIAQSRKTILWESDIKRLRLKTTASHLVFDENDPGIKQIALPGAYNRADAWQAVQAVHLATKKPIKELLGHINRFPGLHQRMEQLAPDLYTNYAHTPEKIRGGMLTALELAEAQNKDVVVIYEPLTNRRQHHIKQDYKNCFEGAKKLYWVPTYLAREDPDLPVLQPKNLIPHLSNANIAQPAQIDNELWSHIRQHLTDGDMVVAMGASGRGSLDEWLRNKVKEGGLS